MIILIGGVSRAGKTRLALDVCAASGAPFVSTDVLVDIIEVVSPELPIGYERPFDVRIQILLPAMVKAAKSMKSLSEHSVFEGELVTPEVAEAIAAKTDVKAYFLGLERPHLETILENEGRDAWLHKQDEEYTTAFLANLASRSIELRQACEGTPFNYVDMTDLDYGTLRDWLFDDIMRALDG